MLALAGVASAQTATPLDRLDPAPAGDAFFQVPSADVEARFRPAFAALLSWADTPLVYRRQADASIATETVRHQLMLHVLTSLEAYGRLKLDLDAPFLLDQSAVISSGSVSRAALGDVRLGARATLLHGRRYFPAAAFGFDLWLPSGDAGAFTSSSSARYAASLDLSADYGRLLWSASASRRFDPSSTSWVGSEVVASAGVAARVGALRIGPEGYVAGSTDGAIPTARSGVHAEVLLGAHYRFGPFELALGGGPGIGRAVGTPHVRLLGMLAWVPAGIPEPGGDDDAAARAASSRVASTRPAARPDDGAALLANDRDGDGVLDVNDLCPEVVGDASPTAARLGCPPDRDADGVPDAIDKCPDEPGPKITDGCPVDTDGDGIDDAHDACPKEKGPRSDDAKKNGCPASVRLEGTQIVILEQVNFATGKDVIEASSFDLLAQVAGVLAAHPEIARVAVDGHTDTDGFEKANLALSQRRAVAVVRWLTEHGVDARRLESRGFGPRRPIADNKTPEGRAKNRRVEFQILRRTEDGERGWRDGPLP